MVHVLDSVSDELGFKIEGGLDSPIIPGDPGIFVQHVVPKGPAYAKLYPGDRILAVNDVNVSHVTRREAKEIISNTTGPVIAIYVKRATRRQ
ncbi:disks large homolog 3-like, partial [Actinia tenebrosa]|uniref:Disks large homolog 3-like n=1 Tax=Actinia tenebrosa TaxID=6105 RepID=A0A6P8IMZ6_ACTTE